MSGYRLSKGALANERRWGGNVVAMPRPKPAEEERMIVSIEHPAGLNDQFLTVLNANNITLPNVTIETALAVPAVACAVSFLSRTMAALPLRTCRRTAEGMQPVTGKLDKILRENWNPDQASFKARQYFWQQVFTGGRGLAWIERNGPNVEAIYPMDPTRVTIRRVDFKTLYYFNGKKYPSEDIIDIPFMLRVDQLQVYSPIVLGSKAIQLALSMNDYASAFFAGGGMLPMALSGPLPAGPVAQKRAADDMNNAIRQAKSDSRQYIAIPPGHELKPIGFDPAKGQMVEARRLQIEEIARIYQIPPAFLQDLSHGTFSNVEQQDLNLVKHLIGQWAAALDGELNLKLFGQFNNTRCVEHDLDGLLRGDIVARMTALSSGVQNALLTPDEAREMEGRAAKGGNADKLFIQGATVPIDTMTQQTDETPLKPGEKPQIDGITA